jgi:hypothetical protein
VQITFRAKKNDTGETIPQTIIKYDQPQVITIQEAKEIHINPDANHFVKDPEIVKKIKEIMEDTENINKNNP